MKTPGRRQRPTCTQLRSRHPTADTDTTATKAVAIEITNVEEPGTVTLDTLQPQVDVEIVATLDGPGHHHGLRIC